MIISYLKMLTFLSKEEIEELEQKNMLHPELREAHRALAREIITDLHGKEEYEKALHISEVLFKGNIKELSEEEVEVAFKGVPSFQIEKEENLIDFLVNHQICSSKREAREFVKGNSISINGEKVTDESLVVKKDCVIASKYVIVRRGKKKYFVGLFN